MSQIQDLTYEILSKFNSSTIQGSGAIAIEGPIERAVEAGVLYRCNAFNTLSNGDTLTMAITTGPEQATVLDFRFLAQAQGCTLRIYEGAQGVVGTPTNCINLNRNVAAVPSAVVQDNVTASVEGALLAEWEYVGVQGGGQTDVVEKAVDIPMILRPNTAYIFELENTTGESNRKFEASLTYADI